MMCLRFNAMEDNVMPGLHPHRTVDLTANLDRSTGCLATATR
jgi:hypothetical protein